MPLLYHPSIGEVVKCSFDGFIDPEMTKSRWVVAMSPKNMPRGKLVNIVPLSTTPPAPIAKFHHKLETILPHNEGTDVEVWAKCDMVFAASFKRLSPWYRDQSVAGKRIYIPVILGANDLKAIQRGILHTFSLGHLTTHV